MVTLILIIRFLKTGISKNSAVLFLKNNVLFLFLYFYSIIFFFSVREYGGIEEY